MKNMMIIGCSIAASMVAGYAIGTVKEKLSNTCKCIIEDI